MTWALNAFCSVYVFGRDPECYLEFVWVSGVLGIEGGEDVRGRSVPPCATHRPL